MFADILPRLSAFLDGRDLPRTLATSGHIAALYAEDLCFSSKRPLLEGSRRIRAAWCISRFWWARRQRRWLEAVVYGIARFHGFPTRTTVNVPCLRKHFGHGLRSLERLLATRRFFPQPIDEVLACPKCGRERVTTASWSTTGMKQTHSTPHLFFGCDECFGEHEQEEMRFGDGNPVYVSHISFPVIWN